MATSSIAARLAEAETITGWPQPDMTILTAGRRPPPIMPQDMFGPTWGLLLDLAEGSGAPVEYVALGFITVAASLIGGKRRAKPYSTSNWSEPPIIWGAAVGDPSSNKSPALEAVTGPLRGIEVDLAKGYAETLLEWETATERSKIERGQWLEQVKAASKDGANSPLMPASAVTPDKPERRRLMVMDTTPEVLGTILSGNPEGTLHLRDELAGWLVGFDRYSPGGRQFWLEAFGGRSFVIDRQKNNGSPLRIPFNGVSVLGGIQPDRLASALLTGDDDGLVARFLWAWPNPVPYQRPRQVADEAALTDIYRRLNALRWGTGSDGDDVPIVLPLDDAASTLFEEWSRENREGLDEAGSLYKGFVGKLPGAVLRISLVMELVRWAANGASSAQEPRTITVQTVAAVAEFVEEFAKPSALRVFGDAALPIVERNAAALGRYIVRHKMDRINARALKRPPHRLPGMTEAKPLDEAIEFLTDADWLKPIGHRQGQQPGRRTSDYAVNPAVHGGEHGPVE